MWPHVQKTPTFPRKKREEDKSGDIGLSAEGLSRYSRAQLLPTNTKGLVRATQTLAGLKPALVFQLCWLLGTI